MSGEDTRFGREHPDVAMQAELWDVLQQYPDVVERRPDYVAALLADYADSLRHLYDLDTDVESLGDGMMMWHIGDETAFINVPREGEYLDIDEDALHERLESDDA